MSKALKEAIDANDEAAARKALKGVKDLTRKLPGAAIPLSYAIERGAENVIDPLLEIPASYDALDIHDHPFNTAARKNQIPILRKLAARRIYDEKTFEFTIAHACINDLDEALRTIIEETKIPITAQLIRMSLSRGTKAFHALLQLGANVNTLETRAHDPATPPLFSAIEDPNKCRVLLDAGADVNLPASDGRTALIELARLIGAYGFRDFTPRKTVLDMLIKAGANPAATDARGNNAMMYLRTEHRAHHRELIAETLDAFRDAGCPEAGPTADLFDALYGKEKNIPAAIEAIKKGADPNRIFPTGNTPLTILAHNDDVHAVGALIDAGADPNQFDAHVTPLINAAMGGNLNVLKLLIARGADLHAVEKGALPRRNAFMAAEINRKPDAAAYLKSLGVGRSKPKDFEPIKPGIESLNDFEELLIRTDPRTAADVLAASIKGAVSSAQYGADVIPGKKSFVVARPKGLAWTNIFQITPAAKRWRDPDTAVDFAKPVAKATGAPLLFIQYSDTSDAAEIHRIEPDGSATRQDSFDKSMLEEINDHLDDKTPDWAKKALEKLRADPNADTDILRTLPFLENFAAASFSIVGKAGTPLELSFDGYPAEAFDAVLFIST